MLRCIVLLLMLWASAAEQGNPMRKIINLLQGLRKEVEVEGEKRKALFENFMCYCETNIGKTASNLEKETAHAEQLKSTIEELSGSNEQLKAEIKEVSDDLAEDTKAAEEATKVRKTEAEQFSKDAISMKESIQALDKAIPALRAGLEAKGAASLIETIRGPLLHGSQLQNFGQHDEVMALLQGQQPSGGSAEILGIIVQMRASFKDNLEEAVKGEEEAIATFDNLMAGKNKEIAAGKSALEEKEGQLAAQIQALADASEDLEDTKVQIENDEKFLLGLKKECAEKTKEQEMAEKTQMEEMKAIQETIKILNDDDALEMFKKTIPQPGMMQMSFLQTKMTTRSKMAMKARAHALDDIDTLWRNANPSPRVGLFIDTMRQPQFVQQPDQFAELKGMINKMIADMQQEQKDDEKHKVWCRKELDITEDETQQTKDLIESHSQTLEEKGNELATIQDEMKTLKMEIADLDHAVMKATAQREKEKDAYTDTISEITIALSLVKKAKDRLSQFYVRKPASFISEQAASINSMETMFGFQTSDSQPATAGAYQKKTGAASGILSMMDEIRQDLKLSEQEAKSEETNSQSAYDATMAESNDSKQSKEKDVINKEAQASRIQEEINIKKKGKDMAEQELASLQDRMKALHDSCDFLMANFEIRKKARASEIEGLGKSMAILSGANFGFTQVDAESTLEGAAFLQLRSHTSR